MDRKQTFVDLTQRLAKAAAAEDWNGLTAANATLRRILPELAAQGSLSADEREALLKLHAVHQQTYQDCIQAKNRLGMTLSGMQANKEGWMAYALTGAIDEDEKQA